MSYLQQCLSICALSLGCGLAAPPALAQVTIERPAVPSAAPVLVRLDQPLSPSTTTRLVDEGITILHHYGNGQYVLSAKPNFAEVADAASLPLAATKTGRLSAFDVDPKLEASLSGESTAAETADSDQYVAPPSSDVRPAERHTLELVLAFPGAAAYLTQVLAKADFRTELDQVQDGVTLRGNVTAAGLRQLMAHPYLLDASPVAGASVPYIDFPLWEHRATVLNSAAPGDLNLNGAGVVIGIGDGGALSMHPDVAGRVLYSTEYYNPAWESHPDFVTSLAGGAGTLDPRYRGTASQAKFVIESSSTITYRSPTYLEDHGMTITNNSYGPIFNCTSANRYYGTSASIDAQLRDNPKLTHVYSAGNSGRGSCDGTAAPYGSIPGGAQVAKNSIAVGNSHAYRTRYGSSSCGPTLDGRLKPELIAIGHGVRGNDRFAGYGSGSGTSLSAPAVVGMLALFTEQYKRLHGDTLPNGALLKAIACNTADDLGRSGPDYEHGFGMISGTGGVRTLTQQDHDEAAVHVGAAYERTLHVPAGTEQLRVLLYWHDRPGPTQNLVPTLVDDLDLYVLTPNGDTLRPWVLDALRPELLAARGRDSINNIEQVTLMAPAPGTYTFVVTGRKQPFGKTDFALTWAALQPNARIVHPVGGESFDPGVGLPIAWECSPGQTGNWKIEYAEVSSPTGAEVVTRGPWQIVHANLGIGYRSVTWTPPGTPGARYVFRLTNLVSGITHEVARPVTMLGTPAALATADVCAGKVRLQWSPVSAAVAYEVLAFDGRAMALIERVATAETTISGLTEGKQTFFSVVAIDAAGNKGPRAPAVNTTPRDGSEPCAKPLPVEWNSVETTDLPFAVQVTWGITQERDTDLFEVQRSGGSTVVGSEWLTLGTLPARGYATSPAVYTFDDEHVRDGETYYYRIRQQDRDGAVAYSKVIAHTRRSSDRTTGLFVVAQNPIDDQLTVHYRDGDGGQVGIYDLAGRRLAALSLSSGTNHLTWPAGLPSGVYLMRVADGGQAQTLRVLKR